MLSDNLEIIQEIFGRKWARYILRVLHENPLRYTEIQYHVTVQAEHTVHSRTLTETLRWLERQHYVEKHQDRYRLTSLGEECARIIQDLRGRNADRNSNT